MYCEIFNATVSTQFCVRRREAARVPRIKLEDSLLLCKTCKQGEVIEKNPKGFIDRDHIILCKIVAAQISFIPKGKLPKRIELNKKPNKPKRTKLNVKKGNKK